MNTIFKKYTGNAMLNNALMTIEALGGLSSVSEITPELLLELYKSKELKDTNKRLKNYTMLFTKNGPLHNDKQNGDKVYDSLFASLVSEFENEGKYICEISGLRFNKSFQELYQQSLKLIGFTEKEIKKKDTNIGRTWFPLIGGLGSDAQALPQAKFMVDIHPICIAILQFLPLSSLLYKGGILLIDSSNFGLTRRMVFENVETLSERIEAVSSTDKIENVKDFSKGNYLIRAIEILTEKEEMEESYSDLNLWSFSNSGTGASCEIDRVPNSLIKKLMSLKNNPKISLELKYILSNQALSRSFLENIEDNKDWFLLYPNVFGSGKKKVEHKGFSVDFLEEYYSVIKHESSISSAKYIVNLINKYKSKEFEKLLEKTDAWNMLEFRIEIFKVLLKATENGEWDIIHQVSILDDNNELPIRNQFYKLHRLIHFYYQNKVSNNKLIVNEKIQSNVLEACKWMIDVIKKDEKRTKIISELVDLNQLTRESFENLLIRAIPSQENILEAIIGIFCDNEYKIQRFGMNQLLRLYFSQKEQEKFESENLNFKIEDEELFGSLVFKINSFIDDYFAYYSAKYNHRETGEAPIKKYAKFIDSLISERSHFSALINEAIENTNNYLIENGVNQFEKWSKDDLFVNPLGVGDYSFSSFVIKFLLKKHSINLLNNN